MAKIPDDYRDLLERPIVGSLATVMPDGQIQITPVWMDIVGNDVRVNTAAGRQKHRNLVERKTASVLVIDPENPMRYLEVRGHLTSEDTESGDEVIDKLAKDYLGVDEYPFRSADETRVTLLISPDRVTHGA